MQLQLADVWAEFAPRLERLVRAMQLDRATSDDVLQDVYLQAMRECPADLTIDEMRRGLYRVTVNRCNWEDRQAAGQQSLRKRWAEYLPRFTHARDAARRLERGEITALVRQQLLRMPPRLYSVLVLRYFAELDSKEIGAILQIPHGTVRSQLRQARLQLARYPNNVGYEHGE